MMRLIDKIERKLYRFAIPNLPLIIAICLTIGFILGAFPTRFFMKVTDICQMVPYNIIYKHEYWRLITWIFITPFATSGFWMMLTPIAIYFYYRIGIRLEAVWGKFMLNFYIFGTIILMDAGIIIAALISAKKNNMVEILQMLISEAEFNTLPLNCSQYLTLSMYLGLAIILPDLTIMLYFLIPIKIKYLAFFELLYLAYDFYKLPIPTYRTMIVCSIIPFMILFLINMNRKGYSVHQMVRKRNFNKKMSGGKNNNPFNTRQVKSKRTDNVIKYDFKRNDSSNEKRSIHRCAICGRTELDNPYLEFRYCSKCNGNYEYCSDHIYTHEHKI